MSVECEKITYGINTASDLKASNIELYDNQNNKYLSYTNGRKQNYVKIENISPNIINAFLSIEDKRFYEHNGVDWKRTLGATANYFLKFRNEFGGSTITQQLIKNVTGEDSYSLKRKIQEIFWAVDLESKMSKQEILESYLTIINLSNGCYGIGAAAEYYFSKKKECELIRFLWCEKKLLQR